MIVDAVGVCESDKTDSCPLEKKPTVALDSLLLSVALGKRDEDTLTTLAGRLARLERQLEEPGKQEITKLAGGMSLGQMSATLLRAIDLDVIVERATGKLGAAPQEVEPIAFEKARVRQIHAASRATVPTSFLRRLSSCLVNRSTQSSLISDMHASTFRGQIAIQRSLTRQCVGSPEDVTGSA